MTNPAWPLTGLFRERVDGEWDFFPFGRFGRGYRVNAQQVSEIVRSTRRYWQRLNACLVTIFGVAIITLGGIGGRRVQGAPGPTALHILPFAAFVGMGAIFVYLYNRRLRRLVNGLPLAETRLTRAEAVRLQAAQYSKRSILLGLVLFALGFIGNLIGIWSVLRSADREGVLLLLFAAVVLGYGGWSYACLWKYRPQ
jgi:hypothetical protein